ncbi:unnamed protein product, partial [Prorocentrum cordatum]
MEDEKFAQLASVLGQSLRDRIVYRRRLRAAGMEDPRGKDLPQPVVKAQRVALQATQRLERAQQAAQEAAEELEAAEAQLVAARGDLEQAKQDAADTAAGDQAGPPVSASTRDDLGKLAGLVNQLVATYEDQLAQLAAGNKPPDTGRAVAQQTREALQKLTAALPAAPPAQASPPRPLMEGSLGACQLTSPWERHQLEVVPTPRSGSATKQRLQNGYGVMSGTGPARTKARVFFGNITQYGPPARMFLEGRGSGFDAVGFCEAHASPAATEQQQLDLQKGNWKVAATPGIPSGRSLDGVAGGEMLAIKKTLAVTTSEGHRRACQAAGRPPPFFGFVPMVWHLLQGNVLVVVAYLVPGLRFRGANQQRLASLAAFLSLVKDTFVLAVGDWDVEPTDWGETEWLQRLGATVIAPGNVRATCDKGEGKLCVVAEPDVPRRTHCGLVIEFTSSNRRWYHQAPVLPSALPLRCPPKIAADPSSRRQRKLAAQASRRREALPEELRDSHDTLFAGADEPGGPAGADDLGRVPFPLPDYTAPRTGRWCSFGGGTLSSEQCCGDALSAATAPVAVRRTSMDDDVDPMDVLADEDDAGFAEPPEHDSVPSSSPVTEVKSALPPAAEARGRDGGAPADIEYLMSSETWSRCAAAVQAWKPSSQRPADQDHFLFARVPLSTDHVSQMHAQWVGTLEEALIQTEQVAGRSADTMRGRGQGYRLEERRMKSTPGRAHLLNPVLEGWQTLSTLLVRLVALLTNGSDPPQQRECVARIVHRHVKEPAAEQLEPRGLARDADGDVAARSIAQPDAILEKKTLYWERVWKDPAHDKADLVEALNDTLRRAADDGLDPITSDQVRAAMRRASSGKARGIDNLSPADLQRMPEGGFDGLASGFIVAAMEVQLRAGPRHLRQRAWLGRRLQPERSVVAGSGNGGKLAQVMLGPAIARAHRACERAQLWTFIDDAVIRSVGTRQSVKADVYQAAVALKQGLDEAGFVVSTKTVLACSHPPLGRAIAGGLVRLGVPASYAAHAMDLGVDTTCGRRRCRKRAQRRFQAAKGRLGRILRVRREVRMAKITKMLWTTGAQPQATHGHQVAGLAPSSFLALRRGAAASAVGKGPGRCLTSTLAALYGQRDPVLELQRQVVSQWLELWRTRPEVHGRVRRAWPRLLKALSQAGPHRWRRVRGPAAAVIAVLLDAEWRPESPQRWVHPTGPNAADEWIIPGPDAECFAVADASEPLDDLMADFARRMWQRAALHPAGDSLCNGADMMHVQRELRRFMAAGALDQWARTVVIVSGGQWARGRQQQAGYDSEVTCQRCGTEKETSFHRIWSCPCNTGHADLDASECLIVRARAGWEQDPALWLRGVCPSDLTTPVFDERQADWVEHQGEPFDSCRIEGEEVLDVFGDGSGGPHT